MKIEVEVERPNYPNFIRLVQYNGAEVKSIPVGDLEIDQVEEYIKYWSDGFRDHAAGKKAKQDEII